MNLGDFKINWDEVEVNDYKPLAEGVYAAKVVASEIGPTKKGDQMMKLTFEVLGENKGRKLFENYMLTHSNPKAVQAGLGKIKTLAQVLDIDLDNMSDTSELHGKPVGIKVKIEESEQYGAQNRITSFQEYEESLLTSGASKDEGIIVDSVEEDAVVEDENVEEVVEEEKTLSPSAIRSLKKADFLLFVKNKGIDLVLTGKKLSELKEEVVNKLYGTEVVEEDEDIIIDDE